nr:SseB family protein [uncultured Desulfuromonas sp.]
MTELDQALADFIEDEQKQGAFYDLVLNTKFYIPVYADEEDNVGKKDIQKDDSIEPVILESEGNHYLMLFENEERLSDWANEKVNYVVLPGFVIVQMTPEKLYWAMNMGTDYQKQFVPEEITWLKDVVQQNLEEAGQGEE